MVALAVLLLAGCSLLPGRQLPFGFPARDGVPELQGVLTDKTGTVTHVTTIEAMDPVPPVDRGMTILGDVENSVIVYWLGGCEEHATIEVTGNGSVTIAIKLQPHAGACDLVGIRRYVRIRFAAPVDPAQTSVEFPS